MDTDQTSGEGAEDALPTLAQKEAEDAAVRDRGPVGGVDVNAENTGDSFVESAEIQQGLDPDIAVHDEEDS